MAYNEQLAARIREHLAATEDLAQLREQKMFGGIAFMWRGNMLVGVHEDRLLIRVPRAETGAALKQARVHPFDITGKAMAGWLSVEADAANTARDLERWIARSRAYVATLPAK